VRHAAVRQDAAVYGQFQVAHAEYFLNSGVQAVMAVEHAHVTDVITIKAPAADTMLPK